jgi:DNA-binding GntR family transcriptional regulator
MEPAYRSLTEEVYMTIRRQILTCALTPGTMVTRAFLAERYTAGHAAVREALSRLAYENLVQVLPREGYLIAPITLKAVLDVLETRLLIEPVVARQAAGHVDETLLRDAHRRCETPHGFEDSQTLQRFITANTDFHVTVARGTGNERLVGIVRGLLESMERFMYASYLMQERSAAIGTQHSDFVEALISGDAERSEQLMREDILFARTYVIGALLSSKALQSVNLFAPPVESSAPDRPS